jgi:hypothetical protein
MASHDPQTSVNLILSKADKKGVDFIYLSRDAYIRLGTGSDPIYSRFEDWGKVVDLTDSLFGKGVVNFDKRQPLWLHAGILFTDICIEQCKRQAHQPLPENTRRGNDIISPTGPYEYLGYARRCFNTGLCEAGSEEGVYISKEDWLACQRGYAPVHNPDWGLCQSLAEGIKREGRMLLTSPPLRPGNDLERAVRIADKLVKENI